MVASPELISLWTKPPSSFQAWSTPACAARAARKRAARRRAAPDPLRVTLTLGVVVAIVALRTRAAFQHVLGGFSVEARIFLELRGDDVFTARLALGFV